MPAAEVAGGDAPMRPLAVCLLLVAALAAGRVLAAEASLLSASAPGAYAARFWPDRVVLSCSADTPVTVRVSLPQPARWAVADDGQPLAHGSWRWDEMAGYVSLDLPVGDHRVQVGWVGTFRKPPDRLTIPVLLGDRRVGTLSCVFRLQDMTATGALNCPTALARVLVRPTTDLAVGDIELRCAGQTVTRWRQREDGLLSAGRLPVRPGAPFRVTVSGYNLTTSPVAAVELRDVELAYEPPRGPGLPPDGIVIEAEDYTAEGNGRAEVSDRHFETSGGKCVYNNAGDGHWLEWTLQVPQAGRYALYCRAACQEAESLRTLQLDGRPLPGAGLVRFPGTGGWGYSATEWAVLQLAGAGRQHPPLELSAGPHRLRMIGISGEHLNLDCFVLVKHR